MGSAKPKASTLETKGDFKGQTKATILDVSKFCPSAFTLTFVIEVVGIDVWHDCNEGWLDLGPPAQGVKLSYQLYYGQNFEVDVLIWPHIAKVASKMENPIEVYLPALQFGERRQFGEIIESETPLFKYIEDMIWLLVMRFIPASFVDGPFNKPSPVKDVRHQDAVLEKVQDVILNHRVQETEVEVKVEEEEIKTRAIRTSVNLKAKKVPSKEFKKRPVEKTKYELKLSGDWILAGIGRLTPFVTIGDRPADMGEMIALISSNNLPAPDDLSVFFVNVGNLTDVPVENFKQNSLTHIYTRWTISEEEHNSKHEPLQIKPPKTEVNFNDHHSVPLSSALVSDVMAIFLDEPFCLELRGIRTAPPLIEKSLFFGYDKDDIRFGTGVPPPIPDQTGDILIAQTRINAKALTNINGFIKAEFPLYPPQPSAVPMDREGICTNDINAVRCKVKPDLYIQPGVILQAQMSIELSLGLVGCKPKSHTERYSRLYCLISDTNAIMTLIREITEINESVLLKGRKEDLLTGFALDTGDTVMLYVEGPQEGQILRLWERTEDFYPDVKPVFSTSARYICRLYPELLVAIMPFNVIKMFVPLSVLLGITPIYARPALPLPTRSAVLKIGRLIASNIKTAPSRRDMPTAMELKSFRLELCAAPRPPNIFITELARIAPGTSWDEKARPSVGGTKINWKPKVQQ